jgi:superfamily I DNA and/or RNA helicase
MSSRKRSTGTTPESNEHFVRMAEWLGMESAAEIERMAERRKTRDSARAEKSGETLLDLVIEDDRPGLGGRHLLILVKRNREHSLPWNRLRAGSPVVVSKFPEDDGNSHQGVVSRCKRDSIEVALSRYPDGERFRVDLTADEVTRRRQMAAIHVVRESKGRLGHLRKISMGEVEPEFKDTNEFEFVTHLNESQQAAVKRGLAARDVAIIHGPPGTGKTTTVIELIIQAVKRGDKVLACAPSNTAVDNLLERLAAANQRVVRLGHPARVSESLRAYTLDGLVEDSDEMAIIRAMQREAEELYRKLDRYSRASPGRGVRAEMRREAKRLNSDARLLEKQTINNIIDRAQIVCATSTFNEDLVGDRWFDLCVIDEACQSTEPGAWVPLLRAEKFVLAGDHQQLPPTVLSQEAARQGFSTSLLERMVQIYGDRITHLLTMQYRMHEQIMEFSSQQFYEGQLTGDLSVMEHLLSDLESVDENELTSTPLLYVDSAGANWDEELEPDGLSKRNPQEATLVLKKARELIEAGVPAKGIAIIAPYAAQVRLLRQQCEFPSIEIDTVDGFQGREKEAVLITLVRSNPDGEIGFLGDVRRMNVALTRARRKLIVIGDSATLGGNPFYQQMLEYFDSQNSYRSVWEEIDYD